MEFKPLIMPRSLYCDKETLSDYYGKFYVEPLERGFGITLGNTFRRVLLSSIQGAAITSIHIEGVEHEFKEIGEGIAEDVLDLILNLKMLNIRWLSDFRDEKIMTLVAKGPKEITAADITLPEDIEILNPEQHLATLEEDAEIDMEMVVSLGRGYVPADTEDNEKLPIGEILMDANFSPIRNVRYNVENARVGQRTDFDRLILEVWTNGTIKPQESISFAANILKDHISIFSTIEETPELTEMIEEPVEEEGIESDLEEKLNKSIEELELSVRSYNCLEAAGIKTIRDLVQKSESEMLKYRNFGRKSLSEIKNILRDMGLSFNMDLEELGVSTVNESDYDEES